MSLLNDDQDNTNWQGQKFQIISLFSIMDLIKSTVQVHMQTLLNMNTDAWMCTGNHELLANYIHKGSWY